MTLLRALTSRHDPEERTITNAAYWGAWAAGNDVTALDSATGVSVNRDSALGLSAVWSCVSLIGDSVATLPIDTYTVDDRGVRTPARPRPVWMDTPNPEQTKVDFVFGQVASLLLDGNAFVYTVRDRKGDVAEAWVLDPNFVQVRREWVGRSLKLVYYVSVGKGQESPVGPFRVEAGPEMFHVMAFQQSSSWPRGIAPLDVAKRMFGSGIAGQEMGARYFGHGMNAAGVIQVEDDMTSDQAQILKRDFSNANAGLGKMHMPPVLTGGAKWVGIQINPEQAQFIQQREFSVTEIARFFRVPPYMIGELSKTTSWGKGVEEQGIGFVTYTLRPWIERLEEAWSRHMLIFQPDVRVGFNVNGLLRGDHAARASWYANGRQWGWLSVNDIRVSEGEPPIGPDGDIYLEPVNMQPPGVITPSPTSTGVPQGEGPEPTTDEGTDLSRSLNGNGKTQPVTVVVQARDSVQQEMIETSDRLARGMEKLAARKMEVHVPAAEAPVVHVTNTQPRGKKAIVRRVGDNLEVTYQDEETPVG